MEEEKGIQDYIQILKRHKNSMMITAITLFLIAAIVAYVLPAVYKSTATILIEQQEIPQELVRSTVTSYADQRIQIISQRVMSTKNLKTIIDKYDLYIEERKRETFATVLQTMREDIQLEMISADVVDPRSGRPTQATIAFSLSFSSESPKLAQRVANELVSIYLNENLKYRTDAASETSDFLRIEAKKLAASITEVEVKLAEFKKINAGNLPELQQMNMRLMDRTEEQMVEIDRKMNSLTERKLYLTAELTQMSPHSLSFSSTGERIFGSKERLKALQAEYIALSARYASSHPDVMKMEMEISALEKEVGGVDKSEFRAQLKSKKAQLVTLKKRYSLEHPDVEKLNKEIAYLETELLKPVNSKKGIDTKPDNPIYIQFQTQLHAIKAEINALEKSKVRLSVKLEKYEEGLLKSPQVEREYRMLVRDYDNARAKYHEIKAKQMEADIAQTMEKGRKGERFTLVEPPLFPEEPIKPNRVVIVILGLVLAIIAGVAVALLKSSFDAGIYGAKQLTAIVGAPPLIVIPLIENDADLQSKTGFKLKFAGTALIGLVGILVLFHLLFMPLDVLWFSLLRRSGLNS